jgi:histone-binding protein RBBP4
MLTSSLPWPSLTVQWFPDIETVPDSPYFRQRMLLGTRTAHQGDEYLRIAQITLPNHVKEDQISIDVGKYDSELNEIGGYNNSNVAKVEIVQKIDHIGEVNRARYMPQNPDILATSSSTGSVYVFDRTKHPLEPTGAFKPDITLAYHSEEGYGLSWSPSVDVGKLLTGAGDSKIALWDITQFSTSKPELEPSQVFEFHTASVNDVQWHPAHPQYFGSVSDDGTLQIHDLRIAPTKSCAQAKEDGHTVNTIAFNSFNEYFVATGSSQGISLYDLRKLPARLNLLSGHKDDVVCLEWSPHEKTVLVSASPDRRVFIWDVALMGSESKSATTPPELLFIHGGHSSGVFDIGWNPAVPWMLGSVADDNLLHVWKPSNSIVGFSN